MDRTCACVCRRFGWHSRLGVVGCVRTRAVYTLQHEERSCGPRLSPRLSLAQEPAQRLTRCLEGLHAGQKPRLERESERDRAGLLDPPQERPRLGSALAHGSLRVPVDPRGGLAQRLLDELVPREAGHPARQLRVRGVVDAAPPVLDPLDVPVADGVRELGEPLVVEVEGHAVLGRLVRVLDEVLHREGAGADAVLCPDLLLAAEGPLLPVDGALGAALNHLWVVVEVHDATPHHVGWRRYILDRHGPLEARF
mmetsp:Transcript_27593/g.82429  ORF Transcript_27593/g.82429 Transcript_27593/m.82429 type:complete len:253 (+) Transcript_27593:28-786(+)